MARRFKDFILVKKVEKKQKTAFERPDEWLIVWSYLKSNVFYAYHWSIVKSIVVLEVYYINVYQLSTVN